MSGYRGRAVAGSQARRTHRSWKVRYYLYFELPPSVDSAQVTSIGFSSAPAIMSVFSLDATTGNPVTSETVDKLCGQLGVKIDDSEKEAYTRLLAVFHDASEQLMAMDGNQVT